jgi:hypothetical protein
MGRMETSAKRKAKETAEAVEGEERAKAVRGIDAKAGM